MQVPEHERAERCSLGTDECVIDGELFFVRGCLEVPVLGEDVPLSWGAWVSLSQASFRTFLQHYEQPQRSHVEPMFGWLCSHIAVYGETLDLKTRVHLRDNGIRPFVELEPTDHPLAVEQREGITPRRLREIYEAVTHGRTTT